MDFKNMSMEELQNIQEKIKEEMNRREKERRAVLLENLVKAYNELIKEFPYTCLDAEYEDETFDVIELIPYPLSVDNFS